MHRYHFYGIKNQTIVLSCFPHIMDIYMDFLVGFLGGQIKYFDLPAKYERYAL